MYYPCSENKGADQGIKSKISTNGGSTSFFDCNIGVRQGENLSPILFTYCLNDLEKYLTFRKVNGIDFDVLIDDAHVYFKLLVLLYTDDTVLFSDNRTDMQQAFYMSLKNTVKHGN